MRTLKYSFLALLPSMFTAAQETSTCPPSVVCPTGSHFCNITTPGLKYYECCPDGTVCCAGNTIIICCKPQPEEYCIQGSSGAPRCYVPPQP
ncbi:hypothetical protein BDZ91DRAFT_710703 [Kalaharituber pfeilii]|nr:hypothetical protein BDZ91DRAFT_710703 [Kalaharituber pfeilii]